LNKIANTTFFASGLIIYNGHIFSLAASQLLAVKRRALFSKYIWPKLLISYLKIPIYFAQ
jgi:hypothetical protein